MRQEINIINRKVKFEYEFIDTYTAGIQLVGSEVKSIRNGKVSLVDSFCIFNDKGELFSKGINIPNDVKHYGHVPVRDRKLLLNKKELRKLQKDLINGLTIVPYRIFCNQKGMMKMEIVLAKGKKNFNKKETIKKRDVQRELQRNL